MTVSLLIGAGLTALAAAAMRDTWLGIPLLVNAILNAMSGVVAAAWSWRYRRTPKAVMPRGSLVPVFTWAGTLGFAMVAVAMSCLAHGGLFECFPLLFRPK